MPRVEISTRTSSITNAACLRDERWDVAYSWSLATWISDIAALKYALPIVAVLQLASIWIASRTLTLAGQAQANALKAVPADEEIFAQ